MTNGKYSLIFRVSSCFLSAKFHDTHKLETMEGRFMLKCKIWKSEKNDEGQIWHQTSNNLKTTISLKYCTHVVEALALVHF